MIFYARSIGFDARSIARSIFTPVGRFWVDAISPVPTCLCGYFGLLAAGCLAERPGVIGLPVVYT